MRITLKLPPVILSAPTKRSLDQQIAERFEAVWGGGSLGSGWMLHRNGGRQAPTHFALVHYQKFRRKMRCRARNRGPRQLVRPPHWIGYCYLVPVALVKQARQHPRTFTLQLQLPADR